MDITPMTPTGRNRSGHVSAWQAIMARTDGYARSHGLYDAGYLLGEDGAINVAGYLAGLPGDASAVVHAPVRAATQPAAYAELSRRSAELHTRLQAITAELEAAYRAYTSGPSRDVTTAIARGKPYTPATHAGFDEAVRTLDNEACAIAQALPELVRMAREVAAKVQPQMHASAAKVYAQADAAHAMVEHDASDLVASARKTLEYAEAKAEAMRNGATRQALLDAANDLALAERLADGAAYQGANMDRFMALITTARPSYVAPVEPERPAGYVNSISSSNGY